MKLSAMLNLLADKSKEMEAKIAEWQASDAADIEKTKANIKAWSNSVDQRIKDSEQKFNDMMTAASDTAKAEWSKAKDQWNTDVANVKAKVATFESEIAAKEAGEKADMQEAYAASVVKYALEVQGEAERAVAKAAEARVEADAKSA